MMPLILAATLILIGGGDFNKALYFITPELFRTVCVCVCVCEISVLKCVVVHLTFNPPPPQISVNKVLYKNGSTGSCTSKYVLVE
jgi:hypothetical protein